MSQGKPSRRGRGHEPGSPPPRRGDPAGYALVIASYMLFGLTPVLIAWVSIPVSLLLVLRYAIAAGILLIVFWRRRPLAGVMRPGVRRRFVLMAVLDASQALAYFYAVRVIGVAAATFIYFLQPLWVALLAPRLLHVAHGTRRVRRDAPRLRRAGARPRSVLRRRRVAVRGRCRGGSALRARVRPVPDHHQTADARGLQRVDGDRDVPARRAVAPAPGPLASPLARATL